MPKAHTGCGLCGIPSSFPVCAPDIAKPLMQAVGDAEQREPESRSTGGGCVNAGVMNAVTFDPFAQFRQKCGTWVAAPGHHAAIRDEHGGVAQRKTRHELDPEPFHLILRPLPFRIAEFARPILRRRVGRHSLAGLNGEKEESECILLRLPIEREGTADGTALPDLPPLSSLSSSVLLRLPCIAYWRRRVPPCPPWFIFLVLDLQANLCIQSFFVVAALSRPASSIPSFHANGQGARLPARVRPFSIGTDAHWIGSIPPSVLIDSNFRKIASIR